MFQSKVDLLNRKAKIDEWRKDVVFYRTISALKSFSFSFFVQLLCYVIKWLEHPSVAIAISCVNVLCYGKLIRISHEVISAADPLR